MYLPKHVLITRLFLNLLEPERKQWLINLELGLQTPLILKNKLVDLFSKSA